MLRRVAVCLAFALVSPLVAARADAQPEKGVLLKAVIVSRHGVRTPLESFADLDQWTKRPGGWPQTWNPPTWPASGAGDLTAAGAKLAALMGGYYQSRFVTGGLFGRGCPAPGEVFIRADVTPRTKDTARFIADGFRRAITGACPIPVTAVDGKNDPLFHPTSGGAVCPLGADAALAAIEQRAPGGFGPVDARYARELGDMQAVLQCCQRAMCKPKAGNIVTSCALADDPTHVKASGDSVKMEGAIGISSTASEIVLLEYADGLPAPQVGWGDVDTAGLARVLTLHNVQFDYMQRTPYIARRQGSMLLRAVLESLEGGPYSGGMTGPMPAAGAKFVAFVGHDTNVANLAAMLGVDWSASEQLPDKTAPAGALLFELREYQGDRYVLAYYLAQSIADMRAQRVLSAAAPPLIAPLKLPCAVNGNGCRLAPQAGKPAEPSFWSLVRSRLEPACLK